MDESQSGFLCRHRVSSDLRQKVTITGSPSNGPRSSKRPMSRSTSEGSRRSLGRRPAAGMALVSARPLGPWARL
eukprot:15462355-Alexandrium_andersonii.AAC.1